MEKQKTPSSAERVEVFVPKGFASEEPNLFIAVNGVNYLLPRGICPTFVLLLDEGDIRLELRKLRIHLDKLFWKPGWVSVSQEEFDRLHRDAVAGAQWIIDGNYNRTLEMRIKECDTVFFLDYSTELCLSGIEERKGKARSDMPWVEEKLDENFKQCILDFANEKLPKIYELLDKYEENLNTIIFKSREEADNYIRTIN